MQTVMSAAGDGKIASIGMPFDPASQYPWMVDRTWPDGERGPTAASTPSSRLQTRKPARAEPGPRLVDLLLAVTTSVALGVVAAAGGAGQGGAQPGAYLFAAGFGAVMLVRSRGPRTVLIVTVLGVFAYYALGYPPIGIALPAVAALFSAAEAGRTRWAVVTGLVLLGVSAYFRIRQEDLSAAYLFSYDVLTNVALIAAAIALGVTVRTRREVRAHQQHLAALTAVEAAHTAGERIQAERLRIAQDLHDAIGHSMSVIALHNHVAAEALVQHDELAVGRAIAAIGSTTSASMRELRRTVRLLRSAGSSDESVDAAPGLAGIASLVRSAREANIDVTTNLDVAGADLPAAIQSVAYRIVQESLTNVIRHSGARAATVRGRVEDDRLVVEISDDGQGCSTDAGPLIDPPPIAGHGLIGMRERAALLGGRFAAGNRLDSGFVVRADLPTRLDP